MLLESEPAAGAPEAGHHLVADQDDAVAVGDLPHAGEVARRWHHDPSGPGHRLEQDARDRLRPLRLDDPLQVMQRPGALLLGSGRPEFRAI